jgi:DME family drug/metabolite transporter
VAGAAVLWGSSGIFADALVARGVPPVSLSLLRPVVGGTVLLLGAALFCREALLPGWRGFLVLAGVGGGVTAMFQVAYLMSLATAGVPTTVALLYLAPALVLASSGPLLGEWPGRGQVALGALSVGGVWLTVTGVRGVTAEWTTTGVGWGVLAGATYASYTLLGRYATPRYGSTATVLHSTVSACVLLSLALPLSGHSIVLPSTGQAWMLLVVFGLLTVALATSLYYDALGRIEAGRATITSTLEPIAAVVLATFLLDEGLKPRGWAGLAMVVAGVGGGYAMAARGSRQDQIR